MLRGDLKEANGRATWFATPPFPVAQRLDAEAERRGKLYLREVEAIPNCFRIGFADECHPRSRGIPRR